MGRLRKRTIRIGADQVCPFCRQGLHEPELEQLAVCPTCKSVYHLACVEELGGGTCSTLGCEAALTTKTIRVPIGERAASTGERMVWIEKAKETVVAVIAAACGLVWVGLMVVDRLSSWSMFDHRWTSWALLVSTFVLFACWAFFTRHERD
jgi:hypothetical protein